MDEGKSIGHYTILRPLGKGGMGEVYLAQDTKLDRQVAIKVLPESLRRDPERLARFRREAKAAGSLNHPNIATIHSIEEAGDTLFIVMEYVDGETLSEHIPSDGMDLDVFFDTFIPLADALAHAHQQGRVHRDLKPANIMVAKDGTPKILDFGLARIMPVAEEANESGSQDATRTLNVNQLNKLPSDPSAMNPGPKLMGTPQYMSPEQAESQELDHRTDIFSFGVVMYEALTGKKAFEGKSRTSLLGKIVNEDPEPVTLLKPVTPYQLWLAIDRCLRKERTARTQTAYELYNDLKGAQKDVEAGTVLVDASTIPEPGIIQHSERVPLWRQPVGIATMTALTLVLGILGTWLLKPVPEPPLRKLAIPVEIDVLKSNHQIAISPDGSKISYTSNEGLWIRDLAETTPRKIPDSAGASRAFWSPGSNFVGYFAQNTLRKVAAGGGPSFTLCQTNLGVSGGTWGRDDLVVFSSSSNNALFAVSALGGDPQPFLAPDSSAGEIGFANPSFLLDGETLIFRQMNQNGRDAVMMHTGDHRTIVVRGNPGEQLFDPVYSSSGHIMYSHSNSSGYNLWAQPFDLTNRTMTGTAFVVEEDVNWPSVSNDGTLVYIPIYSPEYQLVSINRRTEELDSLVQWQMYMRSPDLSNDGRQIAFHGGLSADIWVYDADRKTAQKLTTHPASDREPVWSPAGDQLIWSSLRNGNWDLYRQATDRSVIPESVVSSQFHEFNPDWSRDGMWLVYARGDLENDLDIWGLSMSEDSLPAEVTQTPFNESFPTLSPDSRYVAYQSNRSGQEEVWVSAFPSGEGAIQVSINGGFQPRWRGNEIFYVENNTLMSVRVRTRTNSIYERPVNVLSSAAPRLSLPNDYDVSMDGQKIIGFQDIEKNTQMIPTITVVENWYAEFKDKQP